MRASCHLSLIIRSSLHHREKARNYSPTTKEKRKKENAEKDCFRGSLKVRSRSSSFSRGVLFAANGGKPYFKVSLLFSLLQFFPFFFEKSASLDRLHLCFWYSPFQFQFSTLVHQPPTPTMATLATLSATGYCLIKWMLERGFYTVWSLTKWLWRDVPATGR